MMAGGGRPEQAAVTSELNFIVTESISEPDGGFQCLERGCHFVHIPERISRRRHGEQPSRLAAIASSPTNRRIIFLPAARPSGRQALRLLWRDNASFSAVNCIVNTPTHSRCQGRRKFQW